MRNFLVKIDAGKGEKIYWGWLDPEQVIHFKEVNGHSHFRAKLLDSIYGSPPVEVMADPYELNIKSLIFPLELPKEVYSIFH